MLSQTEVGCMIATITMLRQFLLVNGVPDSDRLAEIENIGRLLHLILEHIGSSPHVKSLTHLWTAITRNLVLFEEQCFPGEEIQTPESLNFPAVPRPISSLTDASWIPNRVHIVPGFTCLQRVRRWLDQHFDVHLHMETFQCVDDALLVLRTVAHVCDQALPAA